MATEAEKSFEQLQAHVEGLEPDHVEKIDLSREFVVECPEDGPQVAYRFRCPKCGGESIIPRGKTIELPKAEEEPNPET